MPAAATAPARSPRPRPRTRHTTARLVPVAVGRTAVAVGGIADSGLMVRLTRGRLWIGLLATLLVGIVGLNVVALSFSARSSEAARKAEALEQRNSALRAQLASQLSTDEIQAAAAKLGLVNPQPGSIGYLKPGPEDAAAAAKRLRSGELTTVDEVAAATAPAVTDPALADPAVAEPATASTAPVADAAAVEPVAAETGESLATGPAPTATAAEQPQGGVAAP